jgi:hypothetical protein
MRPQPAVDSRLYPLPRYHAGSVVDDGSKAARSDGFASITLLVLVTAVSVGTWTLLIATHARAHDALPTASQPHGWSYPFSCCSGYDCREVAYNANGERPEGYVIKGTGEVITYADGRIKNSPDGEFHWCSVAGANDGHTVCLFVPPRGF